MLRENGAMNVLELRYDREDWECGGKRDFECYECMNANTFVIYEDISMVVCKIHSFEMYIAKVI